MSESTENLLIQIRTILDSSMHALEHGGAVDMSTLDSKVREFCSSITTLPPLQASLYRQKLPEIIEHLTTIVDSLSSRKEAISEEIDMLDTRQRAQAAYGATVLYTLEE